MIQRYFTEESIGAWDDWVLAANHLANGLKTLYQPIRPI
jgi:hypothetical protein